MSRKPLHPRVHFIAGGLIAGVSAYGLLFSNLENKASMQFFLVVGLGFIGFAFLKVLINYIKSGNLKKDEVDIATNVTKVQEAQKYDLEYQKQVAREQALKQQQQPQIITCSVCGAKNYSTSNYCHMCGYKLR